MTVRSNLLVGCSALLATPGKVVYFFKVILLTMRSKKLNFLKILKLLNIILIFFNYLKKANLQNTLS